MVRTRSLHKRYDTRRQPLFCQQLLPPISAVTCWPKSRSSRIGQNFWWVMMDLDKLQPGSNSTMADADSTTEETSAQYFYYAVLWKILLLLWDLGAIVTQVRLLRLLWLSQSHPGRQDVTMQMLMMPSYLWTVIVIKPKKILKRLILGFNWLPLMSIYSKIIRSVTYLSILNT